MIEKVAFFEEFIELCRKHGYCIVSDDPYEAIDVAVFDSENQDWYNYVLSDLKNEC